MSPEMACRLQKAMVAHAGIKWIRVGSMMNLPFLQALATDRERHLVGQCNVVRLVEGEYESDPFLVHSVLDEDLISARRVLCASRARMLTST